MICPHCGKEVKTFRERWARSRKARGRCLDCGEKVEKNRVNELTGKPFVQCKSCGDKRNRNRRNTYDPKHQKELRLARLKRNRLNKWAGNLAKRIDSF